MTEDQINYELRSWAPEVLVDGKWAGNALRFASQARPNAGAPNAPRRWFVPTDSRATPSPDRWTYRLDESGGIVERCSECELDALPGKGQCAGHDRLMTQDSLRHRVQY